ncbi:MAG: tRNA (N(6)-L-threonylcarbamoyladenosine(37)-C(2))-methylthiotransferase MtaB [Armatimonadota bacterium]
MPKIAYYTLGCKVNQYETEKIREPLEKAGFVTVPFNSAADIYIINTCSVTAVADSKSRAVVRKALDLNPEAHVIVTGCYAELEPRAFRDIKKSQVVANAGKEDIVDLVVAKFGNSLETAAENVDILPTSQHTPPKTRPRIRTRAVVKVQDGCDQYCSYCIIPYARSLKYSRSLSEIVEEVSALADSGYKEIVLTGIRLGSYHEDTQTRPNTLPDLIGAVAGVPGIERIRLSSIEPWEVDCELLEAMQLKAVCHHLHIPLQSGDDDILTQMNRPYNSADYRKVIDQVQAKIPDVGITTDIIVGFPGETERAFDNTCALVREIGFSRLHVFRYSSRPGTLAASLPNQISPAEKKSRSKALIELGLATQRAFAASLVGKSARVLVEKHSAGSNQLTGFTDNYVETRFPGDPSLRGQIVTVRIVAIDQNYAIAKIEERR